MTEFNGVCNNGPMNGHLLVFIGAPWEVVLFMAVWAVITPLPLVYTKKRKIRS